MRNSILLVPFLVLLFFTCAKDKETPPSPPEVVAPPPPVEYTLKVSAAEGGSVSSDGGTYVKGTQITLSATPKEGYVFDQWSDGSVKNQITVTVNQNTEIKALFLPNTLNGWYSIFKKPDDVSDFSYLRTITISNHHTLYYFEDNVYKNFAEIKDVSKYWFVDSDERALVKRGNKPSISSDFFTFENSIYSPNYIEDIEHLTNGIFEFTFWKVVSSDEFSNEPTREPRQKIAIPFDYEAFPKMEKVRSRKGFLADPVYSKPVTDIRTIIDMFFEDVKRYGGETDFTADDIMVNWKNFGGVNATAFPYCTSRGPAINMDPFLYQETVPEMFYDKYNPTVAVIYHELGHAVFGLAHHCGSGHIMTGWHTKCYGEKDVEESSELLTLYDLTYNNSNEKRSWGIAVDNLVTLRNQFKLPCARQKNGPIWTNCYLRERTSEQELMDLQAFPKAKTQEN